MSRIRSDPPPTEGLVPSHATLDDRPVVVGATDGPLQKFDARGASIVTIAILATLFALQAAANFVIPVVIGVLLAYALDPAVSFLGRFRIPRWVGASLVLAVLLTGAAWSVYALRHQAQAIVEQLPNVVRKSARVIDELDTSQGFGIESMRRAADALQKATDKAAAQATGAPATPGPSVVVVQQTGSPLKEFFVSSGRNVLAMLGQLIMVFFLAYFILLSGDKFKRKFVKVAGRTLSEKKITVQMFDQINLSIQRFMTMLLVSNVILAIVTWGAFRIIGLENAGTWGVVAGVLHVVPYFGPVVTALATGLAAIVQYGSLEMGLLVAGTSLVIATLVGLVLTTWMAGRIARMNTVAVFVGLLLFGWIWGVWGVLLSVPIVVIVKVVSDHVEGLKAFAEFLGD